MICLVHFGNYYQVERWLYDSALGFQHLITAMTLRHLRRGKTLEGNSRMLHLEVKENPAWGREKGGCLPRATALRMTAAVEATLRNWELAANVRKSWWTSCL